MERSTQKSGLANLLALFVVGAVVLGVAIYAKSLAGLVAAIFLGVGVLVAVVSWFQMRLEDRERLEKFELDELARSRGSATLFEGKEETFPAQQSRLQFEKFFVPGFTIVLCVLQGYAAWKLWHWFAKVTVLPVQNPLVALGLFATCFLALFLIGKYASGVAKLENLRLLRPSAGWLLLGAYLCFLLAVGIAVEEAGVKRVDFQLARGLALLLALLAAEMLLNLIFEIYRPRLKGKVVRPLYESRLVGLLSQPEGLFTTAARTLDYQFGFKVSETWAYQMLAEKLPTFVLALAAAAWLSSCFVFLEPGEQALLERGGRTIGNTPLGPGAHLKYPWPFDKVHRFDVGAVKSFNVGFVPDPKRANENTLVWTVAHYKEEINFLVASREEHMDATTNQAGGDQPAVPVNLIDAGIPVQYRITNVVDWAYGHAAAEQLLEQISTREVVRYLAGVDLLAIMSTDRERAGNELRARIQARATELKLGAEIIFVGMQDIHPPTGVAADFEAVNGAAQDVEAKILRAQGETNKTILLAQANAQQAVRVAQGDALRRTASTAAQAARFANQIVAYQSAPEVYPQRLYLQAFATASAGARKYLVAPTNTHNVFQVNLEDKTMQIYDISVPSVTPPGK